MEIETEERIVKKLKYNPNKKWVAVDDIKTEIDKIITECDQIISTTPKQVQVRLGILNSLLEA